MSVKVLSLGPIAANLDPRATYVLCLTLLSGLSERLAAKHRSKTINQVIDSGADLTVLQRYRLKRATDGLFADLNRHVPAYTYLGYHPADPTNLGVWVDLGALHAAEQRGQISQVTGRPWAGRSPYVLDIGGSGLTLYRRRDKAIIWSL